MNLTQQGLEYITFTSTPSVNITTFRKIFLNSHLESGLIKHRDEKDFIYCDPFILLMMRLRGSEVNHFYKVTPLNNDRLIPIPLTHTSAVATLPLSINEKRKVQNTVNYGITEGK